MKTNVLGVQIEQAGKNRVLKNIQSSLDRGEQIFIVTPYSESIVSCQTDEWYRRTLNSSDIAVADGIGVVWAAHYLNTERTIIASLSAILFNPKSLYRPIPEKIPGSELVWDLAKQAAQRGESIYLLGGFGDTAKKTAQVLKAKYPNLIVAGTHAGAPGDQDLVGRINESGADYLFACFGPKTQERWLAENRQKLKAKLLIGLGGTFDYLAGKRLKTPGFLRLRGFEWLWRLITQPWRALRVTRGVLGLIYYSYKAKHRL